MGKNMDSCFVTGIVGKFDVFSFFVWVGVEGSTVGGCGTNELSSS